MSETTQLLRCDKCGAVLSGYGAERLCAACLLESAILEPETPGHASPAATPLLAFNDYELLEEIARGGMGVVYRARQKSLNRPVAIKMILGGHLANAAEMTRFRTEAETAAQLQHPNIVAIHEVGEHTGQPFFSMEFVRGQNLAQLVRDEPLPSRKAASYLKTIAEAVQYAHSRGVLHRDLKPSNILIDENDQPRITDFGLAKRFSTSVGTLPTASQSRDGKVGDAVERVPTHELTQTGQVLGSPSFIPPEQAAGQKNAIGPASDVYSLGAILYHCLTARPPFVAESLTQTLRLVAEREPVSPRLLNASVPRDLETICLKCLEKDPSRRYGTAQALADDLNRFLTNEPIHARPMGMALKIHRWCLRNKPLAVAGTAILILLLVVVIGSPIALIRINHERKRAEENAANEERQRNEAVEARRNETKLRQQAETQELETRRHAYAADMALVQQALEVNALSRARELLNHYRPKPGEIPGVDLRGWEWRYLWQFTKDDAADLICKGAAVGSVSFSSDGKLLAVGTQTGELSVWDLAARQIIYHKKPSDDSIRRVCFAPAGDLLGYYDRSDVVIWNCRTREEVRRLPIGGLELTRFDGHLGGEAL